MIRPMGLCWLAFAGTVACGSSGAAPGDGGTSDAHGDVAHPKVEAGHDSAGPDSGGPDSAGNDAAGDTGGGSAMTIAKARAGKVTTPITVDAFVTALAGVPTDYPQWYIEDPAGGPLSGVGVYCDPLATTKCLVPEPALNDLIQITGSLSTYMGQLQFLPTAMKVLKSNAPFPPIALLTAADIAPGANSPYRGVFVKLAIPAKLIVDSVTPSALFDTACGAVLPPDGGVDAGAKEGGTGVPQCTNPCEPPVYSGFRANDGAGNEVYIEAPFFHTDPLQSSPECLSQPGVVPVIVGMTFSLMSGVLDVDPYSGQQDLSPVLPADYATP